MGGADPLAGTPLSAREVTTDRAGRLSVVLDVPATGGTRPVVRSVRVRARGAAELGMPEILAATPLNTVARSVTVRRARAPATAGGSERWSVTGLPEGTRLWAHYRHGGETVARVAVGAAQDPCGRLRFELRTLPEGHERAGQVGPVADGEARLPDPAQGRLRAAADDGRRSRAGRARDASPRCARAWPPPTRA